MANKRPTPAFKFIPTTSKNLPPQKFYLVVVHSFEDNAPSMRRFDRPPTPSDIRDSTGEDGERCIGILEYTV
jgi:hypothetical protein